MLVCPECDTALVLERRIRVGDTLECPECEAQLEVVGIDPIELSVVFEDLEDEEWEEDEDWEEEDFDLEEEDDLEEESFEDADDWEEDDEGSDWD